MNFRKTCYLGCKTEKKNLKHIDFPMKTILFTLLLCLGFAFNNPSTCGDGTVYANDKQTEYDDRFDDYPKIKGLPKFKGGSKQLKAIVLEKLVLSDVAKTQIFRLNYQFTVSCDGKIKDLRQIGDPKADDWTNIEEIIESTEADWSPAKHKGNPVDCIYFHSITINGSRF